MDYRLPVLTKSPTTKRQYRHVTRGDFGSFTQLTPRDKYPGKGTYHTLDNFLHGSQGLIKNPFCNPTASRESFKDYDRVKNEIDRQNVPENQQCVFSSVLLAQDTIDKTYLPGGDRRTIKSPRFHGDTNSPMFAALCRPEKAKKHLDRARQLYAVGERLIRKGIDLARANEKQFAGIISRGNQMIYRVSPNNAQAIDLTHHSALAEAFQAYCLIRDYEVNPLPPLNPDGSTNLRRIEEDRAYGWIMGTERMTPNRLGIGVYAREIWRRDGYIDLNYLPPPNVAYEWSYREASNNNWKTLDRNSTNWKLYGNVQSDGNAESNGPRAVSFTTNDNNSAMNKRGKYPSVKTDMTECLLDIHTHLGVTHNTLPEDTTNSNDGATTISTSVFQYIPVAATITAPAYQAWVTPNQDHAFFPTGKKNAIGLYIAGVPTPPVGLPVEEQGYWDARISVDKLKSEKRKLQDRAVILAERERLDFISKQYGASVNYIPSLEKLTMWPSGPLVHGSNQPRMLIGASNQYSVDPHDVDNIEHATNPYVAMTAAQFDKRKSSTVASTGVYWNPKESAQKQLQPVRDVEYRYGIPSNITLTDNLVHRQPLVGGTTDKQHDDRFKRMLQHALFLLCAPPTPWLTSLLGPINNASLNLLMNSSNVNLDPTNPKYGDNIAGEGMFQRTTANEWLIPAQRGWASYQNPFESKNGPVPWIPYLMRIGDREPREGEEHLLEWKSKLIIPALTNPSEIIGPLSLDYQFGTNGHMPGIGYNPNNNSVLHNVYLVRTNQYLVYDRQLHQPEDISFTYGLDFY